MLDKWKPLLPEELAVAISAYTGRWGLAGGYAIDVYLGKPTRNHGDIDIVIPRTEQIVLQNFLDEWKLFVADGDLKRWSSGNFLAAPIYDVWAMNDDWFKLQVMLLDVEYDQWVFKRDKSIRGKLTSFGMKKNGFPIIKPEIQLLYKFYETDFRDKEVQDLRKTFPKLDEKATSWLEGKLGRATISRLLNS